MSRIKEIRSRLEATSEALEALDADLAAGRLGADEHGRQRAEREREVGRLFVSLRRAQREARGRPAESPPTTAGLRSGGLRRQLAVGVAAVLLVGLGIGGGVAVTRWIEGPRAAPSPGGASTPGPTGDLSSVMTGIDLQVLRQTAAREDAPIESLLRLAHTWLDQGQLADARQLYERVLARDPRNAEAITHIGGVLFQAGQVDEALAKVEEALRIDPRYIHAHWDRTHYLYHGKRDFPAAVRAGEAFLEVVPDGPDADTIRKLVAEARRQGSPAASPAPTRR